MLFHSALLTKCTTEGSLLQRKKEAILLSEEELKNIMKSGYKSVTQVSYHKTCVVYQIPLSTTNAVYYGVLTIHESNSCHKTLINNDM